MADMEVAGFMSDKNNNESSRMLDGSMVGGSGNPDGVSVVVGAGGGGGGMGGCGVLGSKSSEGGGGGGGHAPLRRPRVSPTTSLFIASRGRSPSSARSESKAGASPLPR